MSHPTGLSRKRAYVEGDPDDEDTGIYVDDEHTTPRPNKYGLANRVIIGTYSQMGSPASSDISSPSKASRASTNSRTSSPSKQIKVAELQDTGYVVKSFTRDADELPKSLQKLLGRLFSIQEKDQIFPPSLKEEFSDIPTKPWWFATEEPVAEAGQWQFPPPKFVRSIVDKAIECAIGGDGESSWNVEVHHPLLAWVFRNPGEQHPRRLDFRYCTSASIAPRFKPKHAPSKMVDFCVHIMPDDAEKTVIDAVRRLRPASSINHTDWGHLTSRPIVLSIETKLDGEDLTTAITQIATWQAAHWRSLVFEKTSLPDIDFLPGLVVQGHQWYFVATTRDPASGKAHIYLKMLVGSTDTIIGAYQALLCLKCLKDFATEDYWPAFKSYMLPLS